MYFNFANSARCDCKFNSPNSYNHVKWDLCELKMFCFFDFASLKLIIKTLDKWKFAKCGQNFPSHSH